MAKVLYRKYRSKSLSDVVGQEHITKTLSRALKTNRISHAYLFTGPKGVGKTSVARILAHEVNGLPYTSDAAQIDIIEIDAASNRRIDEIRYLRDRVYIAPSASKYKVYIIDEVHMLTKEAFNALLKTLEEPPEHVIFILATTDVNKLPDTIISRTQRFNFKPADSTNIVSLLKSISSSEKINIEDSALSLIAEHGNGSYRDSVGLLDQLANHDKKITAEYVSETLGLPSKEIISKLIEYIENSQSSFQPVINSLSEFEAAGISPPVIANALMDEIRSRLIENQLSIPKHQAIQLLKDLLKIESSSDPQTQLEITLIDNVSLKEGKVAPKPKAVEVASVKENVQKIPLDEESWKRILDNLKSSHNTLYGIVRTATPEFAGQNNLVLTFDFDFHRKRLSEAKNQETLVKAVKDVTGQEYEIECRLNEQKNKTGSAEIENINKIFGQTELID